MIYKADELNIERAGAVLRVGGVVAFPTETVYGLGADAYNADAVASIYEIKGRPTFNPLISHVADIETMQALGEADSRALFLAKKFWPGALTFVLPRKDFHPSLDLVCAGLNTITVRFPNHPVAQQLICELGRPIAAPSANRSQSLSPTSAAAVFDSLEDRVDMILDGGPCVVGLESTILDLTTPIATMLRAGGVSLEEIEAVLGEKVALSDGNPNKPTSPGQLLKHYAPDKPFRINATVPFDDEFYIAFGAVQGRADLNLSPSGDLREAAAHLFEYMRLADYNEHYTKIAMSPIPEVELGRAINDRVRRAAR